MAHGHQYQQKGCTVLDAGKFARVVGAYNVLVFDEGSDVFLLAKGRYDSKLEEKVPL
jgi:hypothetical protein